MVLLNAHKISKSYGSQLLFEDVSFGLNEGERVGLLGPNGAGKSTLAKMLAGRILPDGGSLTLAQGLRVGFLDQDPVFHPGQKLLEAILEKLNDPLDHQAKAYELISHLGLDEFGPEFLIQDLSGGWKKRVALARELILEPQLLILDEPTNHLDVSGILWLEKFLNSQAFSVLMITHDRLFLQRVCQRILDLDRRNPQYLLDVAGGYLEFCYAKEGLLNSNLRQEEVVKNKLRREREWLSRGPQARQTKQKARIKEAHDLEDHSGQLRERNKKLTAQLDFGENSSLPKKLIFAQNISKSFAERELFSDLNLLIGPSTRLGLMGDNGSGKSTLIRCLLGLEPVQDGKIEWAENFHYSYFEQGKETLNFNTTVQKNVCPEGDYVNFQGQFIHVRSYMERFLFFGHHLDRLAGKLSGGEKARLRLAQLMLNQAQVLILDEPTNDLDVETLDVLEESLQNFSGAVVLVTHDRYFMDAICNQILAFPQLEFFADYFQWEAHCLKKKSANHQSGDQKKVDPATSKSPSSQRMSFKDKYELENMEATVLALEESLKEAESQQDYKKMADLQKAIEEKMERWATLEQMKP